MHSLSSTNGVVRLRREAERTESRNGICQKCSQITGPVERPRPASRYKSDYSQLSIQAQHNTTNQHQTYHYVKEYMPIFHLGDKSTGYKQYLFILFSQHNGIF